MYDLQTNNNKDKIMNNSFGTTVTINPLYKEMYYPPVQKLEETEAETSHQQIIWTHMMNNAMQNTVIQIQKRRIA